MTKYAVNLENLQPCRGGKLLSGFPPVFVCVSNLPLDLCYTAFPLQSGAVAQVGSFKQECSLAGTAFCETPLLSALCIQKDVISLFCFFSLTPRAYVVDKP